jgi:hypothetical protein
MATARLRENADPLLPKNRRARVAAPKVKQTPSTLKARATGLDPQRRQSVEDEEASNDEAGGCLKVPGSDVVDQAVVIAVDVDMDPIDATEILSVPGAHKTWKNSYILVVQGAKQGMATGSRGNQRGVIAFSFGCPRGSPVKRTL